VVTGDVTQVDRPDKSSSGLVQIPGILGGIRGLRIVRLEESDVVRHRLVAEIIRAFTTHEARQEGGRS
jgi:phosphate starvation-inducible PhoH-like protein